MVVLKEHVKVTVPELNIQRKEAAAVVISSGRYAIWWDTVHIPPHSNTPENEEDMLVPSDMAIVEYE